MPARPMLAVLAAATLVACGGGSSTSSPQTTQPCTDGATAPCYSGPAGTEGVGACHAGVKTCSGGVFGACVGEKLPAAETCNGADDDCNGTVDEGAAATCASGVCAAGACQAPTCHDGVKNGDETGVDCGGATCGPCAVGQGCAVDADCVSGMCLAAACRAELNGCAPGTAADFTGGAGVTVGFSGLTFAYDRPCIKVTAGTIVTFSGDFLSHPLQGGVVLDGVPTPATSGPFVPATAAGTLATFTLTSAGAYPYYCAVHGAFGMKGAVFVVP